MSLASYYPINSLKPFSGTAYKTSYEWMISAGSRIQSEYPPGYTGHKTGANKEIGYGNPGADPKLVQRMGRDDRPYILSTESPKTFAGSDSMINSLNCLEKGPELGSPDLPDVKCSPSQSTSSSEPRSVTAPMYRFAKILESPNSYCPAAYRSSFSPLFHSLEEIRSGSKPSERRAVSESIPKSRVKANGSGTGYSVGNMRQTSVWEPMNEGLETLTVYRESFKSGRILPHGVWVE